jgi:hypothetical protein
MRDKRLGLTLVLILVSPPLARLSADQVATTPTSSAAKSDAAAAAISAVDGAQQALQRWQKAVEQGESLADEDVARLKSALQPMGARIEWLLEQARQTRRAARDAEPQYQGLDQQIQAWVDQMRSFGEGAEQKRADVVAKLRPALEGGDEAQQYAAVRTLQQVGDVNYDKDQFRPLILPLVKKSRGHLLVSAAYALYNTKRVPEDLELIRDAWRRRTPALEGSISHLLLIFGDGKIDGRSEEIVLEALASPERHVRREVMRGLWGATVGEKLAARLVELADDPDSHGDAIYFGLSTLKVKNEAVVDKLIETLTDRDWNNWDRALWGLGYGVPEELQPKVAKALAEMYKARSDPRTREKCRNLVRQYAGAAAAELLPE